MLDFWALAALFAELEHLDIAWARHAVFIHGFGFGRHGAPEHQQFANVLHGGCIEFGCEFLVHQLAGGAVIAKDADLDEPVGIEGGIHLFLHGRS